MGRAAAAAAEMVVHLNAIAHKGKWPNGSRQKRKSAPDGRNSVAFLKGNASERPLEGRLWDGDRYILIVRQTIRATRESMISFLGFLPGGYDELTSRHVEHQRRISAGTAVVEPNHRLFQIYKQHGERKPNIIR